MLRSALPSSPPLIFCKWAGWVWMKSSLMSGIFRSRISPRFTPIRTLDKQVHRLFGTDRLRGPQDAVGPAHAVVQVLVALLDEELRGPAARSR